MKILDEIFDLIPTGEENAIPGRELARLLNCRYRDITLSVNCLRQQGAVICSCSAGFFKPADDAELLHFVRMMKSRAREIIAASDSAERELKRRGVLI